MQDKLSATYIGPYGVIKKLNHVVYRLDLPIKLEEVHNMFHVSQLRKYIPNLDHIIITEPIEVTEDLVKVLWTNYTYSEAT
mgnify:CR=1 FL=1